MIPWSGPDCHKGGGDSMLLLHAVGRAIPLEDPLTLHRLLGSNRVVDSSSHRS
jgi:hypothetical protein